MAIDTTGEFWHGDSLADLGEYLRESQPGGYPVARVRETACAKCGGTTFAVLADDEEGCAQTRCLGCGDHAFVADSGDYWAEAEPDECACPCGGEAFEVAVGFAVRASGDVRWISVGLIGAT